jgi:prepilin peptidase CpaA
MATILMHQALFAVFPLALAYAAISDLMTMTISNRVTLILMVAFVVLSPATGMDLGTFGYHWAAGGIVLAVAFTCFAFGWIGGGDAKLASVMALWLGWDSTIEFVAIASIFGGVLTLSLLSFRRSVLPAFVVRQPWIQRLHDMKAGVPYGVALAAAGLVTYPHTIWMQMAIG